MSLFTGRLPLAALWPAAAVEAWPEERRVPDAVTDADATGAEAVEPPPMETADVPETVVLPVPCEAAARISRPINSLLSKQRPHNIPEPLEGAVPDSVGEEGAPPPPAPPAAKPFWLRACSIYIVNESWFDNLTSE
jgi:hypothetical protein